MADAWERLWASSKRYPISWYAQEFLLYLIRWFSAKRCSLILEPGAGSGRFSYYLSQRGCEVVALDLSSNAVKAIRTLAHEGVGVLHVVRADILEMPFRDNVFDVVFNEGVVEHFFEPLAVLREMVRVTRGEGIVIFSVPNICSFHTVGKVLSSGSPSLSRPYGFERSFSKRYVESLLGLAGLRRVEVHSIGLFYGVARYVPHPIYWVLYRIQVRLRRTAVGILMTEWVGFQVVGKGEKLQL